MTTFNETLRQRRELLRISLAELARRTSISKAYLHRLEQPGSTIQPSIEIARRLASALGLQVPELVSGGPPQPLPPGLNDYLSGANLDERDVAALVALAPYVPSSVPAKEWGFAHDALQRSLLRDHRDGGGPSSGKSRGPSHRP